MADDYLKLPTYDLPRLEMEKEETQDKINEYKRLVDFYSKSIAESVHKLNENGVALGRCQEEMFYIKAQIRKHTQSSQMQNEYNVNVIGIYSNFK